MFGDFSRIWLDFKFTVNKYFNKKLAKEEIREIEKFLVMLEN